MDRRNPEVEPAVVDINWRKIVTALIVPPARIESRGLLSKKQAYRSFICGKAMKGEATRSFYCDYIPVDLFTLIFRPKNACQAPLPPKALSPNNIHMAF